MPIVLVAVFLFGCANKKSDVSSSTLKLWYKQPANAAVVDDADGWKDDAEWLKALPLGNGALGAMVFGDVGKERVQLNENSMWSGSPDDNDNANAYPAQAEIRKLLFAGKYKEATRLTELTQICKGKGTGHGNGANVPFGCFQTLGDLWIDFENKSSYENYYRELDMADAVARVSYTQDGIRFEREIFVSEPDQLMVVKLTADKPGSISFNCSMTRPERFQITAEENQLIMTGALSDGKGGEGVTYMARLSALAKNGTVQYANSHMTVKDADEVMLLLTASTNYVLKHPNYNGRDYKKITEANLENGRQQSYEDLLGRHKKEYQKYFSRVNFKLTSAPDTLPTDKRIQKFKESKSDLHLIELIFQYGRYLLISSSRPGTLPANLQGIWANKIQTPWNGDYHTNINVQMNYWLAETAHLGEMHMPLFDLIASLQQPGAKTARIHYNADGWVLHPVTNVWGFTSPGEVSDWGMHLVGSAWITTHIMEHYYFTLDREFLKERYATLEGATKFYLDWLIENPKTGELVSGPSVSPENQFRAPDGSISKICMAPSHDQQVIWHLFKNFIDASNALDIENEFLQKVKQAQQKLAKPKIGSDGRLMEWNEEFEEVEKGHRHMSHLYALHPGYQIDVYKTPELALAAKKSLDFRIENGGGHTGWSAAWLINQYARLGEAKSAEQSLHTVLAKSTSANLFGLHPPFQMDANFGTTAGIVEMLLQSQSGEILLLPALPKDWGNGEVKGLCARGGFVIDMKWESSELVDVCVYSKNGGIARLKYRGKEISIDTKKNVKYFPMKERKDIW